MILFKVNPIKANPIKVIFLNQFHNDYPHNNNYPHNNHSNLNMFFIIWCVINIKHFLKCNKLSHNI